MTDQGTTIVFGDVMERTLGKPQSAQEDMCGLVMPITVIAGDQKMTSTTTKGMRCLLGTKFRMSVIGNGCPLSPKVVTHGLIHISIRR